MRHRQQRYQLNRFTSWRKATLKSMARNLLVEQSVRTTRTKAKAAQPLIENLIALAKENTLNARRRAFQILCDHSLVKLLFDEIGPRFAKRTSGFTRVLNLGYRRGDNARLVILELTELKKKEKRKQKKEKETKPEEVAEQKREAPEGEARQPKEEKPRKDVAVKERHPTEKKPTKKFLGGLRQIFRKKSDSL